MLKSKESSTLLGLVAGIVVLCILPFVVSDYYVEILIYLLLNIILASSYRLIMTVGDWSLSHLVSMGVGAYTSAIIVKYLGWPFWMSMPLAGVVAGVIGWGFIYPLLRTVGFGFFIASYAIGEFVRLIWIKVHNPFGGPRGMIGIPSVGKLGPIDFSDGIPFYFLTLLITLVCLAILYRIDRSPMGNSFKAVKSDADLAESVGIDVWRSRTIAFVTGSFFAGIAGAVLAHRLGAIDPHVFDINVMVYLIIWVVVGGDATFAGPIIGVVLMTIVFEVSRPLLSWRPLLFGAILIGFLIFLPGGMESMWFKFRNWFGARKVASERNIQD